MAYIRGHRDITYFSSHWVRELVRHPKPGTGHEEDDSCSPHQMQGKQLASDLVAELIWSVEAEAQRLVHFGRVAHRLSS